jgi:hypothetical protein
MERLYDKEITIALIHSCETNDCRLYGFSPFYLLFIASYCKLIFKIIYEQKRQKLRWEKRKSEGKIRIYSKSPRSLPVTAENGIDIVVISENVVKSSDTMLALRDNGFWKSFRKS